MTITTTKLTKALWAPLAAALALPAMCRAAGLETLSGQAAGAFESAVNAHAGAFSAVAVPASGVEPVALAATPESAGPSGAGDVLSEIQACRVVDAKFFLAPTLEDGVRVLAPCMEALSGRYGVPLVARAGNFGVADTDSKPIAGIDLRVEAAALPMNSTLLRDLQHSLNLRRQQLMGFPARVLMGEPEFHAQVQSSLQQAVDHCPAPMVIRPLDTVGDFIRYYGRCLSQDPSLKIKGLRPADAADRNVAIWTEAADSDVSRMNGSVTVRGPKGPVTFIVEAYR